jgi:hypothetical protein
MPSKPHETETVFAETLTDLRGKALDAASAFAETNQRIAAELVEFSSSAAKETLRACTELQAAALEAARTAPAFPGAGFDTADELRQDPFGWYRKTFVSAIDGTQKAYKVLEANAQIWSRSAERLQASAERSGKQIQETVTGYVSRLHEIYRSS